MRETDRPLDGYLSCRKIALESGDSAARFSAGLVTDNSKLSKVHARQMRTDHTESRRAVAHLSRLAELVYIKSMRFCI